jgi:hypothetical protein
VKEIRNKPVSEIRLGAIKAAIWDNTSADGITRYNVTFTRGYKDGEEWKNTDSFGRDDLLVLAKIADHAHTWIHAQYQSGNATSGPSNRQGNNAAPGFNR